MLNMQKLWEKNYDVKFLKLWTLMNMNENEYMKKTSNVQLYKENEEHFQKSFS